MQSIFSFSKKKKRSLGAFIRKRHCYFWKPETLTRCSLTKKRRDAQSLAKKGETEQKVCNWAFLLSSDIYIYIFFVFCVVIIPCVMQKRDNLRLISLNAIEVSNKI